MRNQKWYIVILFLTGTLYASKSISLQTINGSWLLLRMDGYKVSQARAILDFNAKHQKVEGFDSCNRIAGKVIQHHTLYYTPHLLKQEYPCRGKTQRYVSKRLQQSLKEGFIIQKSTSQGEKGILLKSHHHRLFLKKMERPFLKKFIP